MVKDNTATEEQNTEKEEITEFSADQPHPETPPSVLAELGYEEREYQGAEDDAASEDTWDKLKKRKSATHTLVMPDPEPERPGDELTFTYTKVGLGHSLLVHDIAIVSGVIFNKEHERLNDTMEKAHAEGRLAEFLEVQKNNRYYENKVMSIGLRKTIKEIDETIDHPTTRRTVFNAVRGGAVPRMSTDPQTDVDAFPVETQEQEPGQEAQEG